MASKRGRAPRCLKALLLASIGVAVLAATPFQLQKRLQSSCSDQGFLDFSALDPGLLFCARKLEGRAAARLAASVDAFVFDLDGVIWAGNALIDGVQEALEVLRRLGRVIIFATNNSTRHRAEVADRLRKLGLVWAEEKHVFSSGYAAAALLEARGIPNGTDVYVVGEAGLVEELLRRGYRVLGGPADSGKSVDEVSAALDNLEGRRKEISAVVVGLDKNINYYKIAVAAHLVRSGVPFIATNQDLYGPIGPTGANWPGAGSIVAAVSAAAGLWPPAPELIAGKPSKEFALLLQRELGLPFRRMAMVGDNLKTDIAFGAAVGMRTLLVLSGVTDESALRSAPRHLTPGFVAPSVASLICADSQG